MKSGRYERTGAGVGQAGRRGSTGSVGAIGANRVDASRAQSLNRPRSRGGTRLRPGRGRVPEQ